MSHIRRCKLKDVTAITGRRPFEDHNSTLPGVRPPIRTCHRVAIDFNITDARSGLILNVFRVLPAEVNYIPMIYVLNLESNRSFLNKTTLNKTRNKYFILRSSLLLPRKYLYSISHFPVCVCTMFSSSNLFRVFFIFTCVSTRKHSSGCCFCWFNCEAIVEWLRWYLRTL